MIDWYVNEIIISGREGWLRGNILWGKGCKEDYFIPSFLSIGIFKLVFFFCSCVPLEASTHTKLSTSRFHVQHVIN